MVREEKLSASRLCGAMKLLVVGIPVGLFVLGARPFAVGLFPAPSDKLAHAVVFALLAVAIGLASGLRGWKMAALAVAGAVLVGGLDEWHQSYLPGREAGLDDLVADAVGGALGVALLLLSFPALRRQRADDASSG
jgi:hypothetical protein